MCDTSSWMRMGNVRLWKMDGSRCWCWAKELTISLAIHFPWRARGRRPSNPAINLVSCLTFQYYSICWSYLQNKTKWWLWNKCKRRPKQANGLGKLMPTSTQSQLCSDKRISKYLLVTNIFSTSPPNPFDPAQPNLQDQSIKTIIRIWCRTKIETQRPTKWIVVLYLIILEDLPENVPFFLIFFVGLLVVAVVVAARTATAALQLMVAAMPTVFVYCGLFNVIAVKHAKQMLVA